MSLIPIVNNVLNDEFFGFPMRPLYAPMPLMRNSDSSTTNATLRRSSPCYEIHEDDTKFQLSIEVPGVKAEDINIQVEQEGRLMRVSGDRKMKKGDEVTTTHFEKSFKLGKTIDANKVSANLADGILVVTALKDEDKAPVKVAITQNPH
jgi:HSP20 family protein